MLQMLKPRPKPQLQSPSPIPNPQPQAQPFSNFGPRRRHRPTHPKPSPRRRRWKTRSPTRWSMSNSVWSPLWRGLTVRADLRDLGEPEDSRRLDQLAAGLLHSAMLALGADSNDETVCDVEAFVASHRSQTKKRIPAPNAPAPDFAVCIVRLLSRRRMKAVAVGTARKPQSHQMIATRGHALDTKQKSPP